MDRARRRRERGAALLVSMLLLTAMALIGFASLNTVMRDREAYGLHDAARRPRSTAPTPRSRTAST